ncbi:MAG: hypothetical protein WC107_07270 [Patescibacteria group bacterium]
MMQNVLDRRGNAFIFPVESIVQGFVDESFNALLTADRLLRLEAQLGAGEVREDTRIVFHHFLRQKGFCQEENCPFLYPLEVGV